MVHDIKRVNNTLRHTAYSHVNGYLIYDTGNCPVLAVIEAVKDGAAAINVHSNVLLTPYYIDNSNQ